jgi:hypothetical protein
MKKEIEKAGRGFRSSNNQLSDNKKGYLPYIHGATNKIEKVLKRNEITTSFKLVTTIRKIMRSIEDTIEHRQYKGVHKVTYSCGKCYIGETKSLFHVRIKEHGPDIRN